MHCGWRACRHGLAARLACIADALLLLLHAVAAACLLRALFSLRLVDGGPQALVGGDEKYRAACRRCYLQHHNVMQ